MTVRWKPLILLSALFLLVGVMGMIAITFALIPGRPSDLLALARADWSAKRFEKSQIQFKRALQVDRKNPAIHSELARMYADWAEAVPANRAELRTLRLHELEEAARLDKRAAEPRRLLLAERLDAEESAEAALWARELLGLDPKDADANFALASDALLAQPAQIAEAGPYVQALETAEPESARTDWARAELAHESGDDAALRQIVEKARVHALGASAPTIERMIRLRVLVLDVQATTDLETLPVRVAAFREEGRRVAEDPALSPMRVARMGRMLELVQKHLATVAERGAEAKAKLAALNPDLDALSDAIYKKAVDPKVPADLRVYLAYAEHLLFQEKRSQCLDVVDRALKSPSSSLSVWLDTAMQLREVAVKAALSDTSDPKRHDKAAAYIVGLNDSANARYQALGQLFQGVIDLERSGLLTNDTGGELIKAGSPTRGNSPIRLSDVEQTADPKLRASALRHLRQAAEGLSDVATAQALYGVTLLLSQEPALGRQYLQAALRMGNLEARYQIWAAWSMLQAGYPEEAQPLIDGMLKHVAAGKLPAELAGSLHLLNGQVHQARQGADHLTIAKAEYNAAIKAGQPESPALKLRMAQLDVMLGKVSDGERRINAIKSDAENGAAAEQLSILLMKQQGKPEAARKALAAARQSHPDNDDLVTLEAAFLLEDKQPQAAEKLLAAFLARHPTHTEIARLRARVLARELEKPAEARKILVALCEQAQTSAPFVQLALHDLGQGHYDLVVTTIAKIRNRWKESSAGDLLDAQLALARNHPREAVKFLEDALKKDPSNKLALFWKAQLEEKVGAVADAAKIYEQLASERPVKEIDTGLSLATAADWALATQALDNQDFDGAIGRFEAILKSTDTSGLVARSARWRLVQAHAAKGDWKTAKADMDVLLKESGVKVEERIRGANLYRLGRDYAAARAQLNLVLKADPAHSQAVAVAAYLLADEKRPADAAQLLRKAMRLKQQPASLYLMLAAIENLTPPSSDALSRALGVIDEGLKAQPDSIEMVRAKSRVTRIATGDANKAIAVVEERAKNDKEGRFRRLLADVYREENRWKQAEEIVRGLLKENPDDAVLMTALVRIVASQAIDAGFRGDRAGEKAINNETAKLLGQFRAKKPKEIALIEAECDLAARGGDLDRAVAVTQEIDQVDPNSPVGPLLRAKIQAARGNTEGVAAAYGEAVSRAPRRIDIRMALAQASLVAGKPDDALKQAEYTLDADPTRVDALLLKARALTSQSGTAEQATARRAQAVTELKAALAKKPATPQPIYHLIAELQYRGGNRSEAVSTLKSALREMPGDENGVAMLIQLLTEPRAAGQAASPKEMQEATAFAREIGDKDTKGNLCLALAVGLHKAGQIDLALAWAERAAAKLELPVVHLNYGDILLSKAESSPRPEAVKEIFEKAVVQYDLVLKAQANSIEAINNKAWILHRYLNRNAEALKLAESLAKRADPSVLPAEFLDTLGAILEAAHRVSDAEDAYEKGLRKAPDHPVLNYHMGRLLARDRSRRDQAAHYLEKALTDRQRLGQTMTGEAEGLLKELGG